MAEGKHDHGKMDITTQEKTFAGFVKATTWTIIGIVVFLLFLYGIAG